MNLKKVIFLLVFSCILVFSLSAQAAVPKQDQPIKQDQPVKQEKPVPILDKSFFTIQSGLLLGFNMAVPEPVTGYQGGVMIGVANNLKAGFMYIGGQGSLSSFSFFDLSLAFTPTIGIDILAGQESGGAFAGGFEFYVKIFKYYEEGQIAHSLKVKTGYIIDTSTTGFAGIITAGLIGSIGL